MAAKSKLQGVFTAVRNIMLGRQDDLDNRRGAPRVRVRFPVICRIGDEDYLGETVDLSQHGMRVRIPVPVKAGDIMRLSSLPETGFIGRQRLRCKSLWVRPLGPQGYEVGSYYEDSEENVTLSWIQSAIKRLNAEERANRKQRRIPANVYAELQDNEGEVMGRALCINLSTGGCLVRFDRDLSRGDVVRVGLGPNEREPAVLLLARVLSKQRSTEPGYFLSSLRFLPSEKRQHQRLRSFLQTLLEDAEAEGNLVEDRTVELDAIELKPAPENSESPAVEKGAAAPEEPAPEPEKLRIARPERATPAPKRKKESKNVTEAVAPVALGAPAEAGVFRGREEEPAAAPPPQPAPPPPAIEVAKTQLPLGAPIVEPTLPGVDDVPPPALPPLPVKPPEPRAKLSERRAAEKIRELPAPESSRTATDSTLSIPPRLETRAQAESPVSMDPPIFTPVVAKKAPPAPNPLPLGAPAEKGVHLPLENQANSTPAPVPLGAPVEKGIFETSKRVPPTGQRLARTPSLWAARTIPLQPHRRQAPEPRGTGLFIEPHVEDPESDFRS